MSTLLKLEYWVLSIALAFVWVRAGQYFFDPYRLPRNFATPDGQPSALDVGLYVMLVVSLLFPLFMMTLGWIVIGLNQLKGRERPQRLPDPATTKVAFITTFVPGSEPLDMLSRTLKSIQAVDYPHDTWVLDEGNDPDVQLLCEILGVKHFSRKGIERYNKVGSPFTPKSKGGNHNAWYDTHGKHYDIVAQIDTDFIPRKDFLTKTLPYFTDPSIAFVGTPQVYGNMKNFIARGAAQQTFHFYGGFLRGLAKIDSMLMIGANHVVRVRALLDVGLYHSHLTEDLATGISLHSTGWKSTYVPEALAIGEGPETWSAFFKQQFRWAKGCNDLLFTKTVKSAWKMRPVQGILYSWLQMYYLVGATFGIGLVLLGLYFGFGLYPANIDPAPFLVVYLSLVGCFELAMLYAQQLTIRPRKEWGIYFAGRVLMVVVMPIFLSAFLSSIKDAGKHTEFEVTPKGGVTSTVTVKSKKRSKNPYRPLYHVATYTAIVLIIGIVTQRLNPIYVGWALVSISTVLIIAVRPLWLRLVTSVRYMTVKRSSNGSLLSLPDEFEQAFIRERELHKSAYFTGNASVFKLDTPA